MSASLTQRQLSRYDDHFDSLPVLRRANGVGDWVLASQYVLSSRSTLDQSISSQSIPVWFTKPSSFLEEWSVVLNFVDLLINGKLE